MRLGVRAHDFLTNNDLAFMDIMHFIKKTGYETIQLAPSKITPEIPDVHSITKDHILTMADIIQEIQMDVSVLGCYIQPAAAKPEERLRDVLAFQKNITYAKYLNTGIVGTETTHISDAGDDSKKAYNNLKDSVQRMVDTAERENIQIGLEPVADHVMGTPEITRQLIDEIGSDKLKVIYDPANLIHPEKVELQNEMMKRTIGLLGDYIVAVHIKDFVIRNGKKCMVPIGKGVVKYPDILTWLEKNKPRIPVLREHAKREFDEADINYIRKYG